MNQIKDDNRIISRQWMWYNVASYGKLASNCGFNFSLNIVGSSGLFFPNSSHFDILKIYFACRKFNTVFSSLFLFYIFLNIELWT